MDSFDSYRLLLFLHVAAVIVGLGVTFVFPFLQAFAERKGVAATRWALEFSERLENMVIIPGAVLLFLFGAVLIANDYPGYKDDMPGWLNGSIAWFILAFATAIFVQRRNVRKALRALDGVADEAALPAQYVAVGKQIQIVGGLLGVSVLGIAFLMVWKP